ncbi:MAG: helix-turn-helix transcriptional regulator [Acidobacteriaceae bacterium]|nr:helix-turn-helix transcriptional regulator [Acidobacteriaceae bacterium]
MSKKIVGNYLRAHRRTRGLSQRELALLVGYKNEWQVSRHELAKTIPPLTIALAYEVVFEVPVAQLFKEVHSIATAAVALNFAELRAVVERQTAKQPLGRMAGHKLKWLRERSTMQ